MRLLTYFFILFSCFNVFAQETLPTVKQDTLFFSKIDSLYREDQFYFGVTYNRLVKTPRGLSQNGFSPGLSVGFLRDMPINKRRTYAVAVGLGFSYDKYHQNLYVSKTGGTTTYEVVDEGTIDRNKLEQFFVDIPIELRWRNSTPQSNKFWRVYSGFKFRYLIYNKTKYIGSNPEVLITNNSDFNKLQYGPFLSFGYNTWNFHAYYGLNSILKSTKTTTTEPINMRTLNFGLMFYIL